MSGDSNMKPTELDEEQLVRKYGAEVASKMLSIDGDLRRLYKQAVDSVGQDPAQIAHLAEPLCHFVEEVERQRCRCQWQRLMLCSAAIVVLLSVLVSCEPSYRFICAITRILWIKVDQSGFS